MILIQTDINRFWSNVGRKDSDDCWPWTRSRNKDGYGRFRLNGKTEQAHRVVWTLSNGSIPELFEGLPTQILHSCDNPPCCNPRHLFPGNRLTNMADSAAKGRSAGFTRKGELHPKVLIANFQAKEIKERHQKGETLNQIAEIYGISVSAVGRICSGKRWSHVILR